MKLFRRFGKRKEKDLAQNEQKTERKIEIEERPAEKQAPAIQKRSRKEQEKLALQILDYWIFLESLNQNSTPTAIQLKYSKELNKFVLPFRLASLQDMDEMLEKQEQWAKPLLQAISKKGKKAESKVSFCYVMQGINRQDVVKLLEYCTGIESNDLCYDQSNRIACYFFKTDKAGNYLPYSFKLSPLLWALNAFCLASSKENRLNFEDYQSAISRIEKELLSYLEDKKLLKEINNTKEAKAAVIEFLSQKIQKDYIEPLKEFSQSHEKELGFLFEPSDICFCGLDTGSGSISFKLGLINDFYSRDLRILKNEIAGHLEEDSDYNHRVQESGLDTLIDYICAASNKNLNEQEKEGQETGLNRIEISPAQPEKSLLDFFQSSLDPQKFPLGKWPSPYSPALMQQVAINLALDEQAAPSIFSVNGPPGTGKTTLLKEIVADHVVKRAELLSHYEKADDAFIYHEIKDKDGASHDYYSFADDRVNDYGILVCSNNNKAVENITLELPEKEGIPQSWLKNSSLLNEPEEPELDLLTPFSFLKPEEPAQKPLKELEDFFFADLASDLLEADAWGSISARLGKFNNIKRYRDHLLNPFLLQYKNSQAREEFEKDYPKIRKEFLDQLNLVKSMALQQNSPGKKENQTEDKARQIDEAFIKEYRQGLTRPQTERVVVSQEFDREREKLFKDALRFHKYFMASSHHFQANMELLEILWDRNAGVSIFSQQACEAFPVLFQSLFLLTPVISSTFASIQSLFSRAAVPGFIGTLIVDEAGQASPHTALGALFRARKALIVGDPKQLEPVVTEEIDMLQSLFDLEELDPYKNRHNSVQAFADYLNPFGTWLGKEKEREWVGCPLTVHRRCLDPMYSLSNELSYDGTMKQQTALPNKEEQESFILEKSSWIQTEGKEAAAKNHYIKEQGEAVIRLLETKFAKSKEIPDLFVITPFKSVEAGLKSDLNKHFKGNRQYIKWRKGNSLGTVHTFQGQGAREVILVLGCDELAKNAAKWVSKNLINVAVTRAKYRLYIIGDQSLWSDREVWGNTIFKILEDKIDFISAKDLPSVKKEQKQTLFQTQPQKSPSLQMQMQMQGPQGEILRCPHCGGEIILDKSNQYVCKNRCGTFLHSLYKERLSNEEVLQLLQKIPVRKTLRGKKVLVLPELRKAPDRYSKSGKACFFWQVRDESPI